MRLTALPAATTAVYAPYPKGWYRAVIRRCCPIFGNDPRSCYTGRSVLEAAGMGITVPDGSVSLRVNLCAVEEQGGSLIIQSHNGGGIHGKDAETLMHDLTTISSPFVDTMHKAGLKIHITDTFRHIGRDGNGGERFVHLYISPNRIIFWIRRLRTICRPVRTEARLPKECAGRFRN